jgi:hypothetical protein
MLERAKKFVKNHQDDILMYGTLSAVAVTSAVLSGVVTKTFVDNGWKTLDMEVFHNVDKTQYKFVTHYKNGVVKEEYFRKL